MCLDSILLIVSQMLMPDRVCICQDSSDAAAVPAAARMLQGPGEGGVTERLEMTREGFYQLVSLTSAEDFEAELIPDTKTEQKK